METGLTKTLETLMVAVTFAEKNEHETALQLLRGGQDDARRRQTRTKAVRRETQRPQMRL